VTHSATIAIFAAIFGATSLMALCARGLRRTSEESTLTAWALADRRFGTARTWFLLGGGLFTAYTFVAVPGLLYGVGALGFFAIPYVILFFAIGFMVLPRLWTVAAANGCVTVADVVRSRLGSPGLALAVALTGILATMPYIALQLLGLQALLTVIGVPTSGLIADALLTLAFGILAVATYRSGLRAPALIAVLKGVLVFGATVALVAVVLDRVGGAAGVFGTPVDGAVPPLPGTLSSAYTTLAIGSALALLVYPHVTTCVFAARDADTLRRNCALLPAWSAVLAVLGVLGLAAAAAGVQAPVGRGELALPLLVRDASPPWLTGFVLGAFGIGALVPAAIMSVAAASLVARNVYVEFIHPPATAAQQLQVARLVSVVVKVGALGFVLALRTQDAINLQLLGGVWILQTLPAVVVVLYTRWLHRWALMAGWGAGMVAGTVLIAANGFVSVVPLDVLGLEMQVYAALLALALNLVVAVLLTPVLDHFGAARGLDVTALEELAAGELPSREWLVRKW
jgi:SSS family solute:Na+ symporter